MAGLERLQAFIYHEKQEEGSMLCAQHALNSLLQGRYYSAPDLSEFGRELDAQEEGFDDDNDGRTSNNMDDTGFFSVQVLERALQVWGLNLVRWRSEVMKPFQDRPHTQLAFILNYQQHWFTLRRFGSVSLDPYQDPGRGHWYNLNSFLAAPEWVGELYLGMVLQQAEADGYSVFAVLQADPNAHLALARTDADEVAETLPEPTSASPTTRLSTTTTLPPKEASGPSGSTNPPTMEGFEDEDMELQAALQASLFGGGVNDLVLPLPRFPPPMHRTTAALPPMPVLPPMGFPGYLREVDDEDVEVEEEENTAEMDPVAASLARSQRVMQRMLAEQQMAQRELYEDEIARMNATQAARRAQAQQGPSTAEETEEEEQIRRAIEESHASAVAEGHPPETTAIDLDTAIPTSTSAYLPAAAYPSDHVYDDEDEMLQAALRASLEAVPEGYVMPDLAPVTPSYPAPAPPAVSAPPLTRTESQDSEDMDDSVASSSRPTSPAVVEEELSVDEIRKRRLARFGL